MKRSNVIGILAAAAVIVLSVVLISWYLTKRTPTLIQGTVECTTYKASSKVPGRIDDMKVAQGDRVEKGQLLYTLSTPELEAKLRQAEAVKSAAAALDAMALAGARVQQIEAAMNMWQKAQAMNLATEQQIRGVLGDYIYGVDYETLPEALGKQLKAKGLTISFAESCTGGLASSMVTDIPGSSEYLMGSVVSYTNQVKHQVLGVSQDTLERYTAVSEETCREMAEGIRRLMGTDLGVSITGIAGPGGGTPEKPVGLVYVGVSDKNGTQVQECRFKAARTTIKLRSAMNALSLAMDRVKDL